MINQRKVRLFILYYIDYDLPRPYIANKEKPVIIKDMKPTNEIYDMPTNVKQNTSKNKQSHINNNHSHKPENTYKNETTKIIYRNNSKTNSARKINGANNQKIVPQVKPKTPNKMNVTNQYKNNPGYMTINRDVWICEGCGLPNRDIDQKCKSIYYNI